MYRHSLPLLTVHAHTHYHNIIVAEQTLSSLTRVYVLYLLLPHDPEKAEPDGLPSISKTWFDEIFPGEWDRVSTSPFARRWLYSPAAPQPSQHNTSFHRRREADVASVTWGMQNLSTGPGRRNNRHYDDDYLENKYDREHKKGLPDKYESIPKKYDDHGDY